MNRSINTIACALLVIASHCVFAAEPWPAKPVRVIVPFPPGGYVDLGTRLVAGPLAAAIGQQVVDENRGGAGGSLGSDIAAHAPADGYTLVVGSVGTHAVNQSLYPKLPYNVLRDFVAIARLSDSPNVLAVHPSLPARTTQQLIALARAQPGQIAYASAGSGTSTHLAAVLFETLANVKLVHVAYKGGGPAMIDVVSGQVPVSFGTAASVTPHLKSGRVRGRHRESAFGAVARGADHRRERTQGLRDAELARHVRADRHAARDYRQTRRRGHAYRASA